MGNDRDRPDFARERARRLALDEQQRAAKLAQQATQRLTVGRQTLVEALEPAPKSRLATPGKQTLTTIAPADALRAEPAMVRKVITAIDTATARLATDTPKRDQITRAATTVDRALQLLIARTGVAPTALPRNLLGDLVAAERTPRTGFAIGTVPPPSRDVEPVNANVRSAGATTQPVVDTMATKAISAMTQLGSALMTPTAINATPQPVVATITPTAINATMQQLAATTARALQGTEAVATTSATSPKVADTEATTSATSPKGAETDPDTRAVNSPKAATMTTKGATTKGATTKAIASTASTTATPAATTVGGGTEAAASRGAREVRFARGSVVSMPSIDTAGVIGPAQRSLDLDASSAPPVATTSALPAISIGLSVPSIKRLDLGAVPMPAPIKRLHLGVGPAGAPIKRIELGAGLRTAAETVTTSATTAARNANLQAATLGLASERATAATVSADLTRSQEITSLANRSSRGLVKSLSLASPASAAPTPTAKSILPTTGKTAQAERSTTVAPTETTATTATTPSTAGAARKTVSNSSTMTSTESTALKTASTSSSTPNVLAPTSTVSTVPTSSTMTSTESTALKTASTKSSTPNVLAPTSTVSTVPTSTGATSMTAATTLTSTESTTPTTPTSPTSPTATKTRAIAPTALKPIAPALTATKPNAPLTTSTPGAPTKKSSTPITAARTAPVATEDLAPSGAATQANQLDTPAPSAVTVKPAQSLPDSYRQQVAADEQRVADLQQRAASVDGLDADKRREQVAKTTQETEKAAETHNRRANQQAQHQNKRHQGAKQGASRNKQQVDARAQEQQQRAIAYANRARQSLIDELKAHADTALSLLDMNKEQRIATLTQKLEQQKPIIKQRIDQARTDATTRWTKDKVALETANTKADTKIDTDCNNEKTITIANFKEMRTQLETDPAKAERIALALSQRDQTRYENTKKANIKSIKSTADGQISAANGRLADAQKRAGAKDAEGKATPEATEAASAVKSLTDQIARLTSQRKIDIDAETDKYDGLIERRRVSGEAAANEIRTNAKGYLASLGDKEKTALAEIERIRGEGHALTKQRLDADVRRIGNELTAELQRLDMQFEHQVIEAEQSLELAKRDEKEMTDADKQKARTDITRERDAGIAKIKRASLKQLGAMSQMVAQAHNTIDGSLQNLGAATVLATKQISTLQTSFDQKIDRVKQYLEGKANTAIDNQGRAAAATETSLRDLRRRRYDNTSARGDYTSALINERASFAEQQKQEDAYAKQRQTEMDHLKTREDLEGQRNVKPEQKWDEQTKQAKANELTKALTGGFGENNEKLMYDYAAVRLAFATMTPDQIKELLEKYPDIKTLLDKAEGPDAICLRQVTGASSATEMRAALLNWSTNGALGNDKDTNATVALISPLGYLWTAGGYDKAAMETMFKSMSDAEKKELDALYKDKYGLSVADEIKDETYSVANRDSLLADWTTDPAEKLRLKAQNSQLSGTYGNILGTIKNAGYLFGYEVTNEQAMNVFMAPTDLVAFGLSKITGDDTWMKQQEIVKQQGLDSMIDPNVLMNAQRDFMNDMKPQPWDSPIEKLRKQQQYKDVNENLRIDGRSLAQLDHVAVNNNWQKLWGGNKEMGDAFTALREGNEEKFLRERMNAGLAQKMGSETWIKEGVEDAARRGKLGELKQKLSENGTTYEEMVEKRFGGNDIDVTYFKVLGEEPADPVKDPDGYSRQVASKLAYYQLGGTTGWGNDLPGIAKEMENLPKELKEQVQAHYAEIVKSKSRMSFLPDWAHYAIDPLGNWSTGNVWDDIEMSYGGQWNSWTGGLIGKGTDYEKVRYDIENGKAATPQEQYERALARYRIDMADTSNMSKVASNQALREIEKLEAAYELLPENLRTAKFDSLSPQQKEQLGEINLRMATAAGWQDTGNATQVSYVETVGVIIGTVVSTAIIIVGSIFTGGAVAAIVVPVAAAVIGGLAMIGTKIVMLGDKYSGASFQKDFAEIVIDAVLAGVMGAAEFTQVVSKMVKGLGVTGKFAEKLMTELILNAAQLPGGFGKALLDPELWKGDSADVLNRIKALAGTKMASAAVTSVVSAGASSVIKVKDVPGRSDLKKMLLESGQGALVSALSSGAGAVVEIDPSKPMGAQFLNVLKAASLAGIQSGAQKVGTGLRDLKRPTPNEVAVESDGTVVVSKAESVKFLKELSRAASDAGETISWKQLNTVDDAGRRIIVVTMPDGTERRVAIDDSEAATPKQQTSTEEATQKPKQQTDSNEPMLLTDGNTPRQLTDGNEPRQLTDGNTPRQLTDGNAPKQLTDGNTAAKQQAEVADLTDSSFSKLKKVDAAENVPWDAKELTREALDANIAHVKKVVDKWGLQPNQKVSFERLEKILSGEIQGTEYDRRFFHHERLEILNRAAVELEFPDRPGDWQQIAHYRTIRQMGGIGDNPYDLTHPDCKLFEEMKGFRSKVYEPGMGSEYELNPHDNTSVIRPGETKFEAS